MKVDGDESRRIVVSDLPYTRACRKCLFNPNKLDSCPILDMPRRAVTHMLQLCAGLLWSLLPRIIQDVLGLRAWPQSPAQLPNLFMYPVCAYGN